MTKRTPISRQNLRSRADGLWVTSDFQILKINRMKTEHLLAVCRSIENDGYKTEKNNIEKNWVQEENQNPLKVKNPLETTMKLNWLQQQLVVVLSAKCPKYKQIREELWRRDSRFSLHLPVSYFSIFGSLEILNQPV